MKARSSRKTTRSSNESRNTCVIPCLRVLTCVIVQVCSSRQGSLRTDRGRFTTRRAGSPRRCAVAIQLKLQIICSTQDVCSEEVARRDRCQDRVQNPSERIRGGSSLRRRMRAAPCALESLRDWRHSPVPWSRKALLNTLIATPTSPHPALSHTSPAASTSCFTHRIISRRTLGATEGCLGDWYISEQLEGGRISVITAARVSGNLRYLVISIEAKGTIPEAQIRPQMSFRGDGVLD